MKAALDYINQGYSVIPLQPRGKKPIPGFKWAEYCERRATKTEITAWWTQYPMANIGIITGFISKLIVVDVDRNRGGNENLVYDSMPTGLISKTGSGGFHLFYSMPQEQEQIKNVVTGGGLDLRGERGYVVAPPSVHSNGLCYKWVSQKTTNNFNSSIFASIINKQKTKFVTNTNWLSTMLVGINKGERNNACAKLVGYFAGKGLPQDITMIIITDWNNKNIPPLSEEEIRITVQSVYRTVDINKLIMIPEITTPTTIKHPFDLVSLNDYMTTFGSDAVKWTIDDWLPQETIAFAISPPGAYKTWLLLDLAVSIAGGTPFLNEFVVNDTGPIIIVQQEDFHGQLAERVATIINSRYQLIKGENFVSPPVLPIFFHTSRELRFDNSKVMSDFRAQIERIKPKLVIIDPLYSATSTDDYMSKTAEQMFPLKEMRDRLKCSFMIAHHTKKKADDNHREGLWGSQFLNAFLETGWQVRKTDMPNIITLLRHFKVKGPMNITKLQFEISTKDPYNYQVIIDSQINDNTSDLLFILTQEGAMTISEIADKTKMHRSTVSRRLKLMMLDGTVFKEDNKYIALSALKEEIC